MNKKILSTLVFSFFLFLISYNTQTSASVIDQVRTKSAQSDYEDAFTLQQSYKGQSGVTIESYSPMWTTVDKLKLLEAELLKNKHGEELSYLGRVVIIPNFAAGKNVLGQYIANYKYSSSRITLEPNRTIYLFGGNDSITIESMAYTLAHEYGHHFTFYQLLNRENKLPGNWVTSDYAAKRGFTTIPKVHDNAFGEYIWSMAEIVAEDYVQLFGSETAIKQHTQMNVFLTTPFDTPAIEDYWSKYLPSYTAKPELPLYLTAFEKNKFDTNMYNLQLYLKNLQNKPTYIHATEGTGTYSSVLLDKITGVSEPTKWYNYRQLSYDVNWILDLTENKEVRLNAIQHDENGFNRGSKSLLLNYQNLQANVTAQAELYKDSKNYTPSEIKTMLQEVALANGIPPEILKAIAFIETGMKQYDTAGNPIIATDGGIGIMQITMPDEQMAAEGIEKERLKYDTRYNIETGAKILKQKWNNPNLPKINDKNPSTIENWYFAIMAYNGLSKRNDPNLEHELAPYQERVLAAIRNYSLLPIGAIPKVNITYPYPDSPDLMAFPDSQYSWPNAQTKSTQMWAKGKTVYTFNNDLTFSRLRDGVNGIEIKQLPHYTPLEITSGPLEVESQNNHYVMYAVKGNGFSGYIASSNLHEGNVTLFPDVQFGEQASAITYLQLKKIISGYPDGFKPNQSLMRRHAATMLVKALGLTLPEGYTMKATDMKPGDLYYEEMMIMEAYGLMGSNGSLNPKGNLTRAQMAKILATAYEKQYTKPTTNTSFTDVKQTDWSYPYINTLAFNKITVTTNGSFRPNADVTRSQFCLFLMRTMEIEK